MRILLVSPKVIGGGAEKVANDLFIEFQKCSHKPILAVGEKELDDEKIKVIPRMVGATRTSIENFRQRITSHQGRGFGAGRLANLLDMLIRPKAAFDRFRGLEDFRFPGSRRLLDLVLEKPDIVHLHNLHGAYFDLRYLVKLTKTVPVVWTLHDEWAYTGHCGYSLDCNRWLIGCGKCPYLSSYPSLNRDGTQINWLNKQTIYQQSILYITTPSHWLMNRVNQSMLNPIKKIIIPNGVDLSVFRTINKDIARSRLNLPLEGKILLFVANKGKSNPYKDYTTIESAVKNIEKDNKFRKISLVILGGKNDYEVISENMDIYHVGYLNKPTDVALYYQAADIYLHAARSENYPLTILESLACGTPVIATAVGGIPEQIQHGETGFLVPPSDSHAMANRIIQLLHDDDRRLSMGLHAATVACNRFELKNHIDSNLDYYQEVIEDWKNRK